MGNDIPDTTAILDHDTINLMFDETIDDDDDDTIEVVLRLLTEDSDAVVMGPPSRLIDLLSDNHRRRFLAPSTVDSSEDDVAASALFNRRARVQPKDGRPRASSLPLWTHDDNVPPPEPEAEPLVVVGSSSLAHRFQDALARNMQLSRDVQRLSKDHERLSMQLVQAHHRADDHGRAVARESEMNRKLTRKLELYSERARVANEGYATLKQNLNGVRVDLHKLAVANRNLTGDGVYSDMSVEALEALEQVLECGLTRVRAGLRDKYRQAIDARTDTCIVCLHERVSIVLLPCRHRVLCGTCAVRVQQCPVDRQDIIDMFPTFGTS
ncbi:Aste57867_24595 [Aphanomyces stellatus]|uniref:Aste57867_24595 protein n=1 Tax=Aphanomyces stellatus TaxID=120398 RepID=A0A485LSF1_9STRA|nr:hypothetical protein As57867_024517 [Aphanomyces stellatus]VFU01234.1 Aste57867_24595 [Aphanomyces stellatus]